MPARDILHDVVKEALIKDGWIITHDPFTISFGIRMIIVNAVKQEIVQWIQ